MEIGQFIITTKENEETKYRRVGGICYWGRHFTYKDYDRNCLIDRETLEEIGVNKEKEMKYVPYMGIYKRTGE